MENHPITELFKIGEIELSYSKKIEIPFQKITSSKAVNKVIREIIPVEQINYREHMYVLYIDNSNKILGYQLLSIGGITATIVDIRILMQGALLTRSVGFILIHNHPSGKLKPSIMDKNLTQKVKEAGKVLDIKLLDHLIITEQSYYSFADEGEL